MITLSSSLETLHDDLRIECRDTLQCVLPDGYRYLVNEFVMIEKSKIAGEAQFKSTFRVDTVRDKATVKDFITNLSEKSGTSYKTERGDRKGKGTKVELCGSRECIHHVSQRKPKSTNEPHKGPGRQPGEDCVAGKNAECPAVLKFSLSGSH